MTDTTTPNKQPLFIAFAPGHDLAAAFATARGDDKAHRRRRPGRPQNTPRVVEPSNAAVSTLSIALEFDRGTALPGRWR